MTLATAAYGQLSGQPLNQIVSLVPSQTSPANSNPLSAKKLQVVDIVFDLDWTLINETTAAMAKQDSQGVFQFEGKLYRISDHTANVLLALHRQPGVRISIFSGGLQERNQFAVKFIYDEVQRKVMQEKPFQQRSMTFRPYKVLSSQDLTPVSTDPKLRFASRFKKDLGRFFNLESAVLIDDIAEFSMPGQERNMLWIEKTYNDRPRYELVAFENPEDAKYSAPNKEEWQRDRNKLLRVKERILKALQFSRKNNGSFIEAINLFSQTGRACTLIFN